MNKINNCNFLGNITKDLELKYGQSGKAILKFSLAVKRDKENTDFPNFTAFDKTAELIAKYHSKGSQIAIQSHFQSGSYEKDGKKIYTQDFIVDKISFVNSGKKKEENKYKEKEKDFEEEKTNVSDDEFPF